MNIYKTNRSNIFKVNTESLSFTAQNHANIDRMWLIDENGILKDEDNNSIEVKSGDIVIKTYPFNKTKPKYFVITNSELYNNLYLHDNEDSQPTDCECKPDYGSNLK